MRSVIVILFVGVLVIPVMQQKMAEDTPTVRFQQIVQLYQDGGYCSGFVVGKDLVATAGHCVAQESKLQEVIFIDGRVSRYAVLASHFTFTDNEDWALVFTDTQRIPAYEIEASGAKLGEAIVHIGHPMGITAQYLVFGFVVARLMDAGSYLLASPAIPGESGSPVLNRDGKVVGIITQTMRPLPMSIAANIGPLYKAVSALRVR